MCKLLERAGRAAVPFFGAYVVFEGALHANERYIHAPIDLAWLEEHYGAALANQCPGLWAKAEEAMKTATLDDAGKAKVTELVTKGKAERGSGDHAASEATLKEALKLLGV